MISGNKKGRVVPRTITIAGTNSGFWKGWPGSYTGDMTLPFTE
jgi:hypothetical protein